MSDNSKDISSNNNSNINAYILKSFPVGEKSQMVYCLSESSGVMHLFANYNKSNKKHSNKLALLRSFCKLDISYKHSRARRANYAQQASGQLTYFEAAPDRIVNTHNWSYELLMSAYYLNELIIKLLPKEVGDKSLFDLYEKTLLYLDKLAIDFSKNKDLDKDLDKDNNNFNILLSLYLRSFEWNLLNHCGYGIDLSLDNNSEALVSEVCYLCQPATRVEKATKFILKSENNKSENNNKINNNKLDRYNQGIFTGSELIKIASGSWDDPDILLALRYLLRLNISYYTNGAVFESRVALGYYFKQQKTAKNSKVS